MTTMLEDALRLAESAEEYKAGHQWAVAAVTNLRSLVNDENRRAFEDEAEWPTGGVCAGCGGFNGRHVIENCPNHD